MKNSTVSILLTISGVGLIAFLLYKVFAKPAAPKSPTATTGSASAFDAIYKGFGSLFGGNKSTDNTGQLITASGQALTGVAGAIKNIWGTPTPSPVSAPALVDTTGYLEDPTTGDLYSTSLFTAD